MRSRCCAELALALCLLGVCACESSSDPGRPPVLVLGVDDQTGQGDGGFDMRRAQTALEEALAGSRQLRLVGQRDAQAYRAELAIVLASERAPEREAEGAGQDGLYRAVQVELRLVRRTEAVSESLRAEGSAFLVQDPASVERAEGFQRVLELAIRQAVERIDLQLESQGLPPDKLRALLDSQDSDERRYVLRVLRARPVPELVPRVIELLRDPDPDLVLEAVGVLVAQRDDRAVPGLIRLAGSKDVVFLLQIITAVAEIGGPMARGYLFTLAAGHPESQIRERALEGLARIDRQAAAAVAPEQPSPRPEAGK
ncbi:MAG TPA: HEAT repeat domain-containing protein [Myxococcota bacterium]|nr:HEAT repeat domain-containing protein [Myxococcota bacterium]HRY96284.1 HEAT repeat domain-containing protein [Myxococcota bacterium]HSA22933.1 HEAT repeat domain-containing protein [Myxococcota bacterium]